MDVSATTSARTITIVLSEPEAKLLYNILTVIPEDGGDSNFTADFTGLSKHILYDRIVGFEESLWAALDDLMLRG